MVVINQLEVSYNSVSEFCFLGVGIMLVLFGSLVKSWLEVIREL